uniref:Uncharacterized protein LOC111100689 n=1 Tax=Crassostrea virginica TaxID=6565 RepID=A0A8B8AAJ6_CRAVI|nr:uncharacterized protein LOC111100689 [Crassostrea virginica]
MSKGLQEIFQALNPPAPSTTGLQHNVNKVGPNVSPDGSRGPEKRDRAHLKDIVEGCGYPRDTAIPVEGDGRGKKIISCTTRNKLCSKRSRGENRTEHPVECAATLPYQHPIGREDQAVEEICLEFLSDPEPTFISHITTDGDSTTFHGAERAMAEREQTVEALRDIRHLAQSQKKAADNAKFSIQMFPGRTAADSQATKRKFSVDFMKRCTAEYNQAIRSYQGDIEKLVNTLSFVIDTIIDCYSGRWGRTCAQHSLRAENETQAGYLKGMSNSLPDSKKQTGEHSYSKMKKVK